MTLTTKGSDTCNHQGVRHLRYLTPPLTSVSDPKGRLFLVARMPVPLPGTRYPLPATRYPLPATR